MDLLEENESHRIKIFVSKETPDIFVDLFFGMMNSTQIDLKVLQQIEGNNQ